MMHLIPAHNAHLYPDLIDQMFRLRARVFSGRLGWSVEVHDGREVDKFDELEPLYALAVTADGQVVGTFRLLQTTGPHMLAEVFSELMPDGIPVRSPIIWESTRFCVDTEWAQRRGTTGLAEVTGILLSALLEVGLYAGLSHILTVIDVRMERILRRAGCPIDRLAAPKRIGDVPSLAILMECSEETVATVQRTNNLAGNCIEPVQIEMLARVA
jgi:N-acyl-L-homoserine lactone synthetase